MRALLLIAAGLAACAPAAPERPHVVLITVDTLRPDHLSLNGYARETSPNIDAFAAAAWHYPNAVAVLSMDPASTSAWVTV